MPCTHVNPQEMVASCLRLLNNAVARMCCGHCTHSPLMQSFTNGVVKQAVPVTDRRSMTQAVAELL